MDAAGRSGCRTLVLLLALAAAPGFAYQGPDPAADRFDRGMEHARAGDWDKARAEFLAGHLENPTDKRYLIELGGVEYRTGDLDTAYTYLHRALQLDPEDAYVHDFLGSLHYFQSNYEAALLHWNKVGRPRIANVAVDPAPPRDPLIVDRALAFASGDILKLSDYRKSVAWLDTLDTFENFRVDLSAAENNSHDVIVRWNQMPATVRLGALVLSATVQQGDWRWRNFGTTGGTARTFVRWDAQRRRAYATYGAPLLGRPQVRYLIEGDARSETWNLREPSDFRVRKWDTAATLRFVPTGRFWWETGVRVANRSFPGKPEYLSGASLKHVATARYQWLNQPERRLTSDIGGTIETARLFHDRGGYYGRTDWSAETHWFPHPTGRDLETVAALRAGVVWGSAPIDEWFMLTLNRDYDHPLRGHNGTHHGKRGTAPITRRYVLVNLDVYKQVWRSSYLTIDAGPLADVGWTDRTLIPGDSGALADVGGQVRFRMPVGIALVLSWAWDFRGGSGAFNSFVR